MKNTKQVLALAMAVAMAAGLLAGCGSSASSSAESVASGEATSEAAATDTGSSDGTMVLADTGFEGKFSPFFAASSADQHVIDLTNIALLGADRKGEMILKGIEGETREYNGTDYTYYGPADCEVTENADGTVTYAINMRDDLSSLTAPPSPLMTSSSTCMFTWTRPMTVPPPCTPCPLPAWMITAAA